MEEEEEEEEEDGGGGGALLNDALNILYYVSGNIHRDYYQSVFGYRQYHVLGIKIVLCEPLARIIHYFLFPIHDTADTQRHEGNNLFII